ncbi:MAG: hypothetical protein MR531_13360 [Lachnospiraceae bacterium]|nr:hypothetical protein [Lachnospiraceae bacterium]
MHIAICDDNVADRKHLERLLSRESDKRAGTPNILYIDSYGSKDHFLRNPLMYDMIFMDMTSTPTVAEDIITQLMQMGLDAPLILYSSTIDYTTFQNLPETVVHMKKPYTPEPLPELLKLGDAHVRGNVETIPVPCENGTHYVAKDDILYCMPFQGSYVLGLLDGSYINLSCDIAEVQILVLPYREFCRANKKHIINMRFVSMITPISVMMQDYREFHISPFRYLEIKKLKEEIDELF